MQTARNVCRVAIVFAMIWTVGLLWSGCTTSSGGTSGGGGTTAGDQTDGGDDSGGGATSAEILTLQSDLPVSGNQELSVRYTVPTSATSVQAFYVPESQMDDPTAREYFDFGTALAAGTGQFTIDTADMRRGTFRIGVSYLSSTGTTQVVLSTGNLIVQGESTPTFYSPDQNTTVVAGATVPIAADLGDPEADADWRLFYTLAATAPSLDSIADEQIPQLGTELTTGTGNAVSFSWGTSTAAAGTYLVGISATDTGFSISETVDRGEADRIVTEYCDAVVTILDEEPASAPDPTLSVTGPAANVSVFMSGSVNISFVIDLSDQTLAGLTVFYDTDTTFSNGIEGVLSTDLGADDTTFTWELDETVSEGGHFVGVRLEYGTDGVLVAYAPGTVTWVTTPTLTVTTPATSIVTQPAKPVAISWTTNVPATVAETEVYAVREGDTSGSKITIQSLNDDGNTSTTWTPSSVVGRFNLWVRVVFDEAMDMDDLLASAAGSVRVSTAPQIIWVGSFADPQEGTESAGAIFGGVQSEDNLGSAFSPVGDLDGDGTDEFVMVARYGKPWFANPEGIGHGEGYAIYGSRDRLSGVYNVNTVGTDDLRGVTFAGIRTQQGNSETDGLSDVSRIPDVDGDDNDELVFGFPRVESRGHNVDPDQDGVRPPEELDSLEKAGQFLRGGIVIVSSTNSILNNPDSGTAVINLDLVGQDFDETCVRYEPDTEGDMILDLFGMDDDTLSCFNTNGLPNGGCAEPSTDSAPDGTNMNWGFVTALADDYFAAMQGGGCLVQYEYHLNDCYFMANDGVGRMMTDYCAGTGPGICSPSSPALHGAVAWHRDTTLSGVGYSGFYPDTWDSNDDGDDTTVTEEDLVENEAREPFGARIIGVGLEDGFGTSLTLSDATEDSVGDIIVSAPNRTARGILYQQGQTWDTDWPETGGEIDGLERPAGTPATNADSGVAYLFGLRSLWTEQGSGTGRRLPPKPHQYIVGEPSHCGRPAGGAYRIPNITATRIAGAANEKIQSIKGIRDFNGDGRDDFAVGAPTADGDDGRIYIAFRRDAALEGDYVLEKLELDTNDAGRLQGALITGSSSSQFAFSMATDVDLNGDDTPDLIVGAPGANGSAGEVAIIFASPSLITPAGGTSIDDLVAQGRAARILGRPDETGYFGFNVTSAGDIDGDGKNDLLIAAPGATPRYDSNPDDDDDTLDAFGLDLDGDGVLDNVTGPNGVPEGEGETNDNALDELREAGLVYVIWGSNVIEGEMSIADLGGSGLEGAIVVGHRGVDSGSDREGDFFGGGDAGETIFGGITAKEDRGRSYGLRAAGDVDGDGLADFLVGSVTATPRIDPATGQGATHGGEAYLIYGFER